MNIIQAIAVSAVATFAAWLAMRGLAADETKRERCAFRVGARAGMCQIYAGEHTINGAPACDACVAEALGHGFISRE